MSDKKIRKQITFTPEGIERGKKLAKQMKRSFSAMLEHLVDEECDRRGIAAAPSTSSESSPKLTQKELLITKGTLPSLKPKRGSRGASRGKQ